MQNNCNLVGITFRAGYIRNYCIQSVMRCYNNRGIYKRYGENNPGSTVFIRLGQSPLLKGDE